MAKITDPDSLVVSTNLTLDTSAKTISLYAGGSLVLKDGVTMQALYSKLVELWTTSAYNKYPFPIYTIDARSGQFLVGTDGATYNGWKFLNDTSRQCIRDAGWSEYSNAGVLNRQYVGIVALASGFPAGAQFYYQRASGGSALNFTFTDSPNEGIQVYGDAANGNFDDRSYFKIFCREYQYTYDDAVLGDVGETSTGAFKVSLPVSVGSDLKIQAADGAMSGAPYSSLALQYFASDQTAYDIGAYPFRVEVDNTTANATLEQIYTWLQYKLRQNSDIDGGAGSVTGKTANSLCYFVGDTLVTTQGVFIKGVIPADKNRVEFYDQNSVKRTYAYVSAGSINFNSFLQGAGSYYRMYYTAPTGAGNDYGESGAITVDDATNTAIQGTISGSSVSFTFDYDNDADGGTAGTDKSVTIVAGRPGYAKPVVATGTLNRSKAISISLVAEQDRGYANP